jgi:ATP-dependent DNA helicase RecG
MLVENAEQFGLAQLHQLRGRIGRPPPPGSSGAAGGTHESQCILISDARTGGAEERLRVLAETNDGFRIAEADLKFRGPGELLGREQSGLPQFRFGNLAEDLPLIRQARELVAKAG